MSSFLRKKNTGPLISARFAHRWKPIYLWEQVSSVPDMSVIMVTAAGRRDGYTQTVDVGSR